MSLLFSLPSIALSISEPSSPSYQYEGRCPTTGEWMQLPRTAQSEAVSTWLMEEFEKKPPTTEGKMFGVLVVETTLGTKACIKAFSGLLNGESCVKGWAPPLPGHELFALDEERTLEQLDKMMTRLRDIANYPLWPEIDALRKEYETKRSALSGKHSIAKRQRKARRKELQATLIGEELTKQLRLLDQESRTHRADRRRLRTEYEELLAPLEVREEILETEVKELKEKRRELSRQLQAQMHSSYRLTNFAGETLPLQDIVKKKNLPSGTGDCCAPKLLYYAATHGLKPLGMAEFWWGPPLEDKRVQGRFYEACAPRCQPIMGFLLSGLPDQAQSPEFSKQWELNVLYQDEDILVVDKPSGLLSVPGRTTASHDSALSRARHLYPDIQGPAMVHRLDMETSGIFLIARNPDSQRELCRQFRERTVSKVYEAVLHGDVLDDEGEIRLPLAPEGPHSIKQRVDWDNGRACLTRYRVLERWEGHTRIEYQLLTGRTHQLRVHSCSPEGLNAPILGDQLYHPSPEGRLLLHARSLSFLHPRTQEPITIESPAPF